jgi:hypothetical protein
MTRALRLVIAALGMVTGAVPRAGRADEGARTADAAPTSRDATPPPTTFPVSGTPIATGLPRRHEGKKLAWDPAFNRMDAPEVVLSSAVSVALAGAIAPPLNTGWKGPIGFDESVRNALRLGSYQARLDARDVSDVGLALLTSYPILVDSLIVAYWYRGSEDVAVQMALIDAEAMAVSAAIQGAANFFGGRERPYGSDFGAVPAQSIDCTSPSRYRSFFSGHSALSFTSAALVCAHHMSLDLFESAADPVACVSALVAAGAVATLRVVGDMHYASDVITGALIGAAVGLGFPLLHHYKRSVLGEPASAGVDVRFVIPWFDVRAGARGFLAFTHTFLTPAAHYSTEDLDTATGPTAKCVTLEAELSGGIPAGPGSILSVVTASSVQGVPSGRFVHEETLRVITDPPAIYRARLGYALRLGSEGAARVGAVGEVLDLPGRRELVHRAGIVASFAIDDHLEAMGLLIIPVGGPDSIGIAGGDFGELGLRYRWATGQRPAL